MAATHQRYQEHSHTEGNGQEDQLPKGRILLLRIGGDSINGRLALLCVMSGLHRLRVLRILRVVGVLQRRLHRGVSAVDFFECRRVLDGGRQRGLDDGMRGKSSSCGIVRSRHRRQTKKAKQENSVLGVLGSRLPRRKLWM